jgi:NAD(P)-dependent dehydrogenase (short-subunit alcohol dehydrogenase family)
VIGLTAVSKAATIHLGKSLAKACVPNIRVNSVSAGVMMTDWSKGFDEEHIEKAIQSNSLRKLVNVEEAAMLYGAYYDRALSDLSFTDGICWHSVALAENGSMTVSFSVDTLANGI